MFQLFVDLVTVWWHLFFFQKFQNKTKNLEAAAHRSHVWVTHVSHNCSFSLPYWHCRSMLPGWPINHLIFSLQVKGFCSSPPQADPWQPFVILAMGEPRVPSQTEAPSSFALTDQKGTRNIQTKTWHYSIIPKEPEWSLITSFVPSLRLHRALCNEKCPARTVPLLQGLCSPVGDHK